MSENDSKLLDAMSAGAVAADEMHLDVLGVAEMVWNAAVERGMYQPHEKGQFFDGFFTGIIANFSKLYVEKYRSEIDAEQEALPF